MWTRKSLRTMIEMYGGESVGLGTLSVNIAEEREAVEDMAEGRFYHAGQVTDGGDAKAYEHLGYEYNEK